jgi:hypothetical protein
VDNAALRVLIEETVNRAILKVPVPLLRPGTVVEAALFAGEVEFSGLHPVVLVDGDDEASEMPSVAGPVAVGQRVMVMYYPPSGAMIVGKITFSNDSFVQEFSTAGTFTGVKPAGARLLEFIIYGAGGGGGTGRSDIAGTARPGGGGGGGGGFTHMILPAEFFDDEFGVTVGAGGAGGVNPGAVVADGTTGTAGGASGVATNDSTFTSVVAAGGSGGDGAAAAGALAVAGGRGMVNGGMGANSQSDGGAGLLQPNFVTGTLNATHIDQNIGSTSLLRVTMGGSSGGGITAGNVGANGGGNSVAWISGTSAAGGVTGVTSGPAQGGVGISAPDGLWLPGGGGGGGAPFGGPPPGSGGGGGNGGRFGGGGGGGSGKSSGSVVGDGGDGGDGLVVVIAHL